MTGRKLRSALARAEQTTRCDWENPRRSEPGHAPLPLPGEEHHLLLPGVPRRWFRGSVTRRPPKKESLCPTQYPCVLWKVVETKCATLPPDGACLPGNTPGEST